VSLCFFFVVVVVVVVIDQGKNLKFEKEEQGSQLKWRIRIESNREGRQTNNSRRICAGGSAG
jgi:hypothetical protein